MGLCGLAGILANLRHATVCRQDPRKFVDVILQFVHTA